MKTLAIPAAAALLVPVLGAYYGLRANKVVTFTPHTIHYSFTSYDEEGNAQVSYFVRTVKANGDWRHVGTLPDGTPTHGAGHITRLPNIDPSSPRADILGYPVLVQSITNQSSTLEESYSPDLGDDLRHVLRTPDGRLILKMEAVAVE